MDNLKKWQIYFGCHRHPICITDKDTNICYYCNDEFYRIYEVTNQVIGKRLIDFLPREEYHLEGGFPDWSKQTIFETETYNKRLNQRFFTRTVLDLAENVFVCETIPTENNLHQNFAFEEAMARCMDIYADTEGNELNSFMELLCEFYESERAYVYHYNREKNTLKCASHWCSNPDLPSMNSEESEIDSTFLINWLENDNIAGIVTADIDNPNINLESEVSAVLDRYHTKNMALCMVEDGDHKLVGLVGVSNREHNQKFFDRRLITTIARFVSQDITKRTHDSTLFQVQNRDVLTGLYNRIAYDKKVTAIKDNVPKKLGVISVNINGVKYINNKLGNEAGDNHIKKAGKYLQSNFGFEVFRVSGDEFIGISVDEDKDSFESKVFALHDKMRSEDNNDFSLGSAWAEGKIDYASLLLEADTKMYINKQEYYATGVRSFDSINNTILSDLLSFLDNDEFMIYLQPQVHLKDGSLHGAEALIRRFDKTNQKMVFPDQFIPMYEQASVIRHIDLFVVDTVCQLLARWDKDGKAVPISVNLSRVTLQEYGIVDSILKICDKYHVDHSLVVIEVTERVGLIENDVPSSLVTSFIENGFAISLDDFGCAYSNIVTLAQIQVDEVKLDKSLVDNLTTNRKNHILVKNVLSMCRELEGMSTLAEGIEEIEQANILCDLGCDLGQGYYYSRPIPVVDFEKQYIINNDENGGKTK